MTDTRPIWLAEQIWDVGDGSEAWNQASLVTLIEAEVVLVTCSLVQFVHWFRTGIKLLTWPITITATGTWAVWYWFGQTPIRNIFCGCGIITFKSLLRFVFTIKHQKGPQLQYNSSSGVQKVKNVTIKCRNSTTQLGRLELLLTGAELCFLEPSIMWRHVYCLSLRTKKLTSVLWKFSRRQIDVAAPQTIYWDTDPPLPGTHTSSH